MKLDEIRQSKYRVYVLSRIGKHYEGENLDYNEAKQSLNKLVSDYQADVFGEDPSASVEWHSDGEIATITIPSTGTKIEFAMERDKRR